MSSGKPKGKAIQFPLSPEKYIRTKARSLPVHECLINKNWKRNGMAHIFIVRKQPSGNFTLGVFLVDLLCLGIKDCGFRFNISEYEYSDMRNDAMKSLDAEPCSYELAHNIIYGAIEYAYDLGFKPHKDWAIAQYLLAEDTEDKGRYTQQNLSNPKTTSPGYLRAL